MAQMEFSLNLIVKRRGEGMYVLRPGRAKGKIH